jgi:peptide-methionine (S)-S-oxide reductase
MSLFGSTKTRMVGAEESLPGRATRPYTVTNKHAVKGTPLEGPFPEGLQTIYFGLGCFWGAERKFWQLPGVYTTSVGYIGGHTPNPTYDEVCTGRTAHTEAVAVTYDPATTSLDDLLATFWEVHDPTSGFRQGNDIGTQYRSAVYWTTDEQRAAVEASRDRYQKALTAEGLDTITTEIAPAQDRPYFLAEDHHQQYLYKNPHGYDCHSSAGVRYPR